jgi:hypothetical protein
MERLDEALAAGREAIRAEGAFIYEFFNNILTGLASEISQGRVQRSLNADHGTVIEQVDLKSFQ